MNKFITKGLSVKVPSWGGKEIFVITQDHGNEVTLSNGERIYKAKCVPANGVQSILDASKNRRKEAEKIGRKK